MNEKPQMTAGEEDMVRRALQSYHFTDPEISFIRHNENITCRVTEDGERYVLRIRNPVEGFSLKLLGGGSPEELMRGEIGLLLHLSEKAPFPVQKPVKNRFGEYMTVLEGGIPAQLLKWIDGEPLTGENIGQYTQELGKLAAQINSAAEGFSGERVFYMRGLVGRMKAELGSAGEKGHLTGEQVSMCRNLLDQIGDIMTVLDVRPGTKCLIHADLSEGNLIKTGAGLAPVDFSLSGYGYRAQECGMLAFGFQEEKEREAVRLSYERASGIPIEKRHMNAFGIFSILLFVTLQHDRHWEQEWFQNSMIRWRDTLFSEMLRGK